MLTLRSELRPDLQGSCPQLKQLWDMRQEKQNYHSCRTELSLLLLTAQRLSLKVIRYRKP